VLTRVKGIGNDFALDEGVGCGKGGQSVPAGVGQPSLLVEGLTVGGPADGVISLPPLEGRCQAQA
jgi:TldD protein